MNAIHLVLFDLDGTLADTALDMTFALNQLREKQSLPPLPVATLRQHVGYGAAALMKVGLQVDAEHPEYKTLLEEFLNIYHKHLAENTVLFPGMDEVLTHIENKNIPWGIVTNKPKRFAIDLLKKLNLYQRAACIVCGDTLTKAKPHPEPILHACEQLKQQPKHCLYIGDTLTDVTASKAAGTMSLVTLYGYIGDDEQPREWAADAYVEKAVDIINWL